MNQKSPPAGFYALLLLIAIAALWLRTHDLARRPMHADEANQAVKAGELLETGRYVFDPHDHHGPTLYYAALPIAWLRGERTLAALSETTVRLVPALAGTLAVMLLAALALPFGHWPALAAAAFLAVSPPAVYYSRYFIQETLLVTFALGVSVCARQWSRSRRTGWAVAAGIGAGLMQATKGSAPLFLAAALLALLCCSRRKEAGAGNARPSASSQTPASSRRLLRSSALLYSVFAALLVAALFYSSFFTHPSGLRDAFASYLPAETRLGGGDTGHEKPWWYYLELFGWQREGGLVWHQLGFSALALAGFITALFRRERFLRWAAGYTVLILSAFSLVAYKTPWHAVHFVPGLALLAAGALAGLARLPSGKFLAVAAAALVLAILWPQTRLAVFLRSADPRNPYAYVHSSPDVLKYRRLAETALARAPTDQPIRVIAEEYWPLPWYFRGLSRVGYWSTPPEDCDGALVIVSASQADAVRARLRGAYRESFLGLRPGVLCIVFTPDQ